jgi:hypothetical protein
MTTSLFYLKYKYNKRGVNIMKKLWIAYWHATDNHFDNKAATEVEDVQKGN